MNSLDIDIKNLEHQIKITTSIVVHNNSNAFDSNMLLALYNKYAALQRQNSIKWAQRVRLFWVHDGDLNTSLFHNSVLIRTYYNNIPYITDINGHLYTDRAGIEHAFSAFYFDLWSDSGNMSFVDILHALSTDVPMITKSDKDMLIGK